MKHRHPLASQSSRRTESGHPVTNLRNVDGTFRRPDRNELIDDNARDIMRSYRSQRELRSNEVERQELVFVVGNQEHDLNYIANWTGTMIKRHIDTLTRDLRWAERNSETNTNAKAKMWWLNARIMLLNNFLSEEFTEVESDRRGTYNQYED